MPTKSFWDWQRQSKLCHDCTEEPKDCMRCEIVWDAALKYKEALLQPTIAAGQNTADTVDSTLLLCFGCKRVIQNGWFHKHTKYGTFCADCA